MQPGHWIALVGIGVLLAAVTLRILLPVFTLPQPTGPYPIGTVAWHLVDAARHETQGMRTGGHRELMVQIWYPAERAGPGQAYRTRAETDWKKRHLARVRTHAATAAPVAGARARYPVVLFTPSWTGRRNQNTVQAEELASHGFVVVGIDHPYGSDLTIFPDGRIIRTVLGKFLDCMSAETLQESVRAAEAQLGIRTADVRFVLDELERLDPSGPRHLLAGRLDTSRVGIFGHSFGGAVAAEVCLLDPRFRAGINLDGFIFGNATTHPIDKPFLVLSDDTPIPTPEEVQACRGPGRRHAAFIAQNAQAIQYFLSQRPGCWLTVRGTAHMNFCDSPLYSPVKRWTRAGPIRTERAMEIINTYVVAFFQTNVEGNDARPVGALSSRFPEVAAVETPASAPARRNQCPRHFVANNARGAS